MKKALYTAPETEQLVISFEENIMSAKVKATGANAYEWNDTEYDW